MKNLIKAIEELNDEQNKCDLVISKNRKNYVITIVNCNNPKIKSKIYVPDDVKHNELTKEYFKTTFEEFILYYGGK